MARAVGTTFRLGLKRMLSQNGLTASPMSAAVREVAIRSPAGCSSSYSSLVSTPCSSVPTAMCGGIVSAKTTLTSSSDGRRLLHCIARSHITELTRCTASHSWQPTTARLRRSPQQSQQRRGMANHRHKKIIRLAKGYRGRSKNCYSIAYRRVTRARQYAYRDRKVRKRDFRKLWIQRINAAARLHVKSLYYYFIIIIITFWPDVRRVMHTS